LQTDPVLKFIARAILQAAVFMVLSPADRVRAAFKAGAAGSFHQRRGITVT
jgi:hypothetical protein